jgi:hypothetical protein
MSPPADARHAASWTITPSPVMAEVSRIDPYIVWAHITRYRQICASKRLPIAIEMKAGGPTAQQFARAIVRNGWHDWIWMSALYRDAPDSLANTRFCTAQVTRDFLTHLDQELDGLIERFTLAMPIDRRNSDILIDHTLRTTIEPLRHAPEHGDIGKVIVGVCDDDIAYMHRRFFENTAGKSTRFQSVWKQDDSSNDAQGLGYGRELLKSQIDSLLQNEPHAEKTNVHRIADHQAKKRAHDDHEPHESPLPLIGVQFGTPGRAHRDAAGFWLDVQAIDGIRYIVQRAQDTAGAGCHALINLSYGAIAGPRDGTSLIESALDEMMDTGTCSIVIPGGNSNPSRCHGFVTIAAEATLRWRAPHVGRAPNFIEIWLPANVHDPLVDVCIAPPAGPASEWIALGEVATYACDEDALCTVVHQGRGARGDGHMILVAMAAGIASTEDWLIHLRNRADAKINAVYFSTRQASVSRSHQPRA